MKRLTARVQGRVQGVSFRYTTQQRAISLGLKGWVRNERNGDVSLLAEGPKETLLTLLAFVETGPRAARVDKVSAEWGEGDGSFKVFRIAL